MIGIIENIIAYNEIKYLRTIIVEQRKLTKPLKEAIQNLKPKTVGNESARKFGNNNFSNINKNFAPLEETHH